MNNLKQYNLKRNFSITKEPKGNITKNEGFNFVIQYHQSRAKHYDFRIQWKGVAISFAVPKNLPEKTSEKRLAIQVEDHPVDYMGFSGTIPKGQYGAGTVEIWDKGTYATKSNITNGIKKGLINLTLYGVKTVGNFTFTKMQDNNWLIIKNKPKTTVKNPFHNTDVQLAKLSNTIPNTGDYIYEIKYDGYRIIAYIEDNNIKLKTRNNLDFTDKFPNIVESLIIISKKNSCILDGEIVVLDEQGRSNFSLLQSNIRNKQMDFQYIVFDILSLDGFDLRQTTLMKRKKILSELLFESPENIIESSYVIGQGLKSFELAKKLKLEGIVGKKKNSKYGCDRSEDWIKIKCYNQQEFIIVGYTTTEKNNILSSIVVAYYDNKKLVYAGKVGIGFTERIRDELSKKLKKIVVNKDYFSGKIKNAIFVKPTLIAEIKFIGLTKDKILRQPTFQGLRYDKLPNQVVLEGDYE